MNIQNAFDGKTARVGDKVWSIQLGDAEIVEMSDSKGDTYPIAVQNQDGGREYYTMSGREDEDDIAPSLYNGPPDIIGPPKPKRVVKRKIELVAAVDSKTGVVECVRAPNYQYTPGGKTVEVILSGELEVEE